MLKLQGIKRVYKVASGDVQALKGIDLTFRKNEFVSILGPSGCGKTTMLNIIGGLDKYTDGDLSINQKSTKHFEDRDWDAYRNHSIGFVFQAYNLIPHQTILGNVELALTIAGVSKEERTKRAKVLLDKVGLAGMYGKKPNQLSGGQCQRVAIARALINEPDILLADEPTGALDTVTSVQIMDLMKEISKERLIIMVTHNPELAEKYSTRIVKLKDGLIVDDSNPYDGTKEPKASVKQEIAESKVDKPKMSLSTAFRLSLQNLMSKSKRTLMTAFAGAIGIIGISTVLSVSTGINYFIDNMQEEMLISSPITISESTFDISAMMGGMSTGQRIAVAQQAGWVGIHAAVDELVRQAETMDNIMIQNNIDENYVQFLRQMAQTHDAVVDFNYGINLSNNVFANFQRETDGESTLMALTSIQDTYAQILDIITKGTEFEMISSMLGMLDAPLSQMTADEQTIMMHYEFVGEASRFPTNENELLIVLDSFGEISDMTLAQLGILSQEEFVNIVYDAIDDENFDPENLRSRIEIEKLLDTSFMWFPNDKVFTDSTDDRVINGFGFNHIADEFNKEEGLELSVVGIVQLQDGVNQGMLSSGFYHTAELTQHVLESNGDSEIVQFAHESESGVIISIGIEGTDAVNGVWYTLEFDYDGKSQAFLPVGSSSINIPGMSQISLVTLSPRELGGVDLPNEISIFTTTFEAQDLVIAYLNSWNDPDAVIELNFPDGREPLLLEFADRQEITHQNMLALMMGLVSTFVDMITMALIAFTALSLVVSSVMIAIITYVSVVERIKEIGVIRSLGGRKKDVSRLFNAETFFIGLLSGLAGIFVTLVLSFIINALVSGALGMNIAVLTLGTAVTMITVSVVLNMLAGFVPSRMAAKKDPVVALRSE